MVPEDVRRFILTAVPSIPFLEAVLLFHREPALARSAADVARLLYLSERKAQELLDEMSAVGIVAPPADGAGFRYAAAREAGLQEAIARLSQAYAEDIVGVTHIVHDLTGKSAQRFADAFKLRKDR